MSHLRFRITQPRLTRIIALVVLVLTFSGLGVKPSAAANVGWRISLARINSVAGLATVQPFKVGEKLTLTLTAKEYSSDNYMCLVTAVPGTGSSSNGLIFTSTQRNNAFIAFTALIPALNNGNSGVSTQLMNPRVAGQYVISCGRARIESGLDIFASMLVTISAA
jgi:hypothetical protein